MIIFCRSYHNIQHKSIDFIVLCDFTVLFKDDKTINVWKDGKCLDLSAYSEDFECYGTILLILRFRLFIPGNFYAKFELSNNHVPFYVWHKTCPETFQYLVNFSTSPVNSVVKRVLT